MKKSEAKFRIHYVKLEIVVTKLKPINQAAMVLYMGYDECYRACTRFKRVP